ncbi:MAG: flagellar biosynthesis protein FlhF [Proteobacteria bacterium]|nr:flagellar biosynthesis protein FlhF [Pseudomonadota bacterium]MBU1685961.1 flagellar biosynthesis protein FlhF [Pseudomonadota bacterium]
MMIKRFEAKDAQTAMNMVKKELGEEAVILSTRTLGSPGTSRTARRIEVVAAIDYQEDFMNIPPGSPQAERPSIVPTKRFENDLADSQRSWSPLMAYTPTTSPSRPEYSPDIPHNSPPPPPGATETLKLQSRLARLFKNHQPQTSALTEPALPTRTSRPDPRKVAEWRQHMVSRLIPEPILPQSHEGPLVIALVGPTGVGKTTTAAKLAAWFSIREGLKVTLLTIDSYRIGGTDQLRSYARIMKLPCEIALHRTDLGSSLNRHRRQDIIIIDTAGKSPYDPDHINELSRWFAPPDVVLPYLVLPATIKKEDLVGIIRTYRPLSPAGLMLTKLDETRAYATLCQGVISANLPIAGLCIGQRVPEDYLPATPTLLATLFGKGWDAATPYFKGGKEHHPWHSQTQQAANNYR